MSIRLESDIQSLRGVGSKLSKSLNRLNLYTVKDCLYFFPREYDDRRHLPLIKELNTGDITSIVASVVSVQEKKIRKGLSILEAVLQDSSGRIMATWFNQSFLLPVLQPGVKLIIKGKVESNLFYQTSKFQVLNTEILKSQKEINENLGVVMPVYALTAGVYQSQMRQVIKQSIADGLSLVKEGIPDYLLVKLNLMPVRTALYQLHFPQSVDDYKRARSRLVFEEFFLYQCRLERQRLSHKKNVYSTPLAYTGSYVQPYLDSLGYELTQAQKRVIEEIMADLSKESSMNRLLQGDVGAGKTNVAMICMLIALESDKSAVLMAPTEILATQHYIKAKKFLESMQIPCILLKSKMKKSDKELAMQTIQNNRATFIVGTHALIQEQVSFNNCGIVVIDEQHRFGVMQRALLQKKGNSPHCLFMTATPIPRSFMLTAYGDLDKSIIDELPPGRKPVKTETVTEEFLGQVYMACVRRLLNKEQLYVVYPLVEESEKLDLKSAIEGFETLCRVFSEFKVGLLHGKMHTKDKQEIMDAFKVGEIDILVSTTVIEVGVDVPNASMMIVQHADRFGLSQLHQLRGRVGRGGQQAICYLISDNKGEVAKQRLKAMTDTTDGFKIAEIDLMIRGPGDVLGTKQSGLPNFNISDLIKDEKILILARKIASELLKEDPDLQFEKNSCLARQLSENKELYIGEYLN
jgi:ATP-dependent DNA helicase RecG